MIQGSAAPTIWCAALCLSAVLAQGCTLAAPADLRRSGASGPPGETTATRATAVVATTRAASATAPAIASGKVTIEMGDHFFSPAQLTVRVGTTVVWIDRGQSVHDVTAKDGSFRSSTMTFGDTFAYTFQKPGRYPYICTPHEGDGMIGEVDVE